MNTQTDSTISDADLEMLELAAVAAEDDAETCRSCGEAYQSITVPTTDLGHEVYECICGHRSEWRNGRRLS